MAHGGKRENAGRKAGALTARTRAIAERASAEGISPLEVILDNMRHFHKVAVDAEAVLAGLTAEEITGAKNMTPEDQFKALLAKVKQAAGYRQLAGESARDAAGYIHAKLSSVTVAGDAENPLELVTKIVTTIVDPNRPHAGLPESEGIHSTAGEEPV